MINKLYRITFGMVYDASNSPLFKDELCIKTNDGDEITVPIYAAYYGHKLHEVITGIEIPEVREKKIPGFGAYCIEEIHSLEDYRDASYFLKLCNESKENFRSSLECFREKQNNIRREYILSRTDVFGPLCKFSLDRELSIQKQFDSYFKTIDDITKSKNI